MQDRLAQLGMVADDAAVTIGAAASQANDLGSAVTRAGAAADAAARGLEDMRIPGSPCGRGHGSGGPMDTGRRQAGRDDPGQPGSFIHGAYPELGDNAVVVWCCGEASLFGEVSPFPAAGPRIH
jgi:hypothetical protein